jgi:hypothetical protein
MGHIIGDSAWPPSSYPASFQGQPIEGWCVYIGGDTPHVWTASEVVRLKAQPWCRYIVPVFTRSNPQGASAGADTDIAIAWAKAYGQPSGTLTMWDAETAVDSPYYSEVDSLLRSGDGDLEIIYGSKSTVVQNRRPSGGYDEASWTGGDYVPADTADQFGNWNAYDLNDFQTNAKLWDLRAPVPPKPPAPALAPQTSLPAPITEENDMITIFRVSGDPKVYGVFDCGRMWHIASAGDLEQYLPKARADYTVSAGEITAIKTALGYTGV